MPGGLFCAIGNPLNDGTWQYTWQNGRQLARMQSVDVDASFVYNENGLRVQKTVNNVVTQYTLHGKNIVHMTQGSDELHFFYDAQNKPAVVVFNGTPYSYVKNLQGDIVAILNSAGTAVVNYAYDAWGRPISKTGSMAGTLGTVQPFRYRGYVYDEETGLYYLRSRYYSHIWCRFVNADTYYIPRYNQFSYCSLNPISRIDPNGTDDFWAMCWDEVSNRSSFSLFSLADVAFYYQGDTRGVNQGVRYNDDQQILVQYAKDAQKRKGISLEDGQALVDLGKEYGLNSHFDKGHPSRSGFIDRIWHIHVGPVDHIPIVPHHYID